MTRITIKLTIGELDLLSRLISDQMFRREFIEPKFPGANLDPEELRLGKRLVERLRTLTDKANRPWPAKNEGIDA